MPNPLVGGPLPSRRKKMKLKKLLAKMVSDIGFASPDFGRAIAKEAEQSFADCSGRVANATENAAGLLSRLLEAVAGGDDGNEGQMWHGYATLAEKQNRWGEERTPEPAEGYNVLISLRNEYNYRSSAPPAVLEIRAEGTFLGDWKVTEKRLDEETRLV